MEIAASGLSGYSNSNSIQTRARAASHPGDSAPAAQASVNRFADTELNEKMSAIGKMQSAFMAALSVNGSLEGILQPIA